MTTITNNYNYKQMEDEYGYQKEYLSYEHQIWHFLQDLVVARRPLGESDM